MELTDKQWMRIDPVISQPACKKDSRGRKPRDPREVLNGILWVLRTVEGFS
jgi:transposase